MNKAIQQINNRGTISAVQKASRNVERAKKRRADEIAAGGRSGDVTSGTAIALGSSTSGAPGEPTIRDTRAAAARGRLALDRGRGGGRGRGLRGGRGTCS